MGSRARKLLCLTMVVSMKLLFLLPVLCAAQHLANLNQLTHGGQNAEAYWSPDGKRLIFQSTRDGHECDQIYVMNAADGVRAEDGFDRQRRHHLRIFSWR